MHKEAIGARFIAVSKKCSAKLISKEVSQAFKLIFYQLQSFYDKSCFYYSFKQFWAIENSKPILEKIARRVTVRLMQKLFQDLIFHTLY